MGRTWGQAFHDDTALAGVKVSIRAVDGEGGLTPPNPETTTEDHEDEWGTYFEFEDLQAGEYELTFARFAKVAATHVDPAEFYELPEEQRTREITIPNNDTWVKVPDRKYVEAELVTIQGKVIDDQGAGVGRVGVVLESDEDDDEFPDPDPNGAFTLESPDEDKGEYSFTNVVKGEYTLIFPPQVAGRDASDRVVFYFLTTDLEIPVTFAAGVNEFTADDTVYQLSLSSSIPPNQVTKAISDAKALWENVAGDLEEAVEDAHDIPSESLEKQLDGLFDDANVEVNWLDKLKDITIANSNHIFKTFGLRTLEASAAVEGRVKGLKTHIENEKQKESTGPDAEDLFDELTAKLEEVLQELEGLEDIFEDRPIESL